MTSRLSCHVSLTSELKDFIAASLGSGDYANASEVVRAGLRALRDGNGAAPRGRAAKAWPAAGGECGALIRERDWSRMPLGAASGWSMEMRATIANIVNSPVAKVLMWGPDHVMFYNDAYRAIAGERHPRALGMPVAEAFPEVWDWNRPILAAGLKGETASFRDQPIVFERPEGPETRFLELFYTPVYDTDGAPGGVLCTIVDNSARIAAEKRLSASEAELRRVTDALPLLVSYVDAGHVYRFANAGYEDWFGIAPVAMLGRPVREVLGEAAYRDRRADLDRALSGEAFAAETLLPHRDGRPRRTVLRYIPHVEADGSVLGVHVLGIDVEERARREAEVAASNARFRTAMEAMHGILWTNSADGRMTGEQPGWAALTGQVPNTLCHSPYF